jgi:hypothetical protein
VRLADGRVFFLKGNFACFCIKIILKEIFLKSYVILESFNCHKIIQK